jgi:DNA-binding winged helix-turn-helix (wHTH) protein
MASKSLLFSFRATEVDRILSALQVGDSCSIVGVGSIGKSNLLRFLQQEDVRRAKLGKKWNKYLFLYIDTNKFLGQSDWGLFELMLHQLLAELSRKEIDPEILQAVDNLYGRATEASTQHLALRYLDRAVSTICGRLGLRLVFLFDEFDDLCRTLPSQAFAALRALRDDNKYFLMYVVATRIDLQRLNNSKTDIEAFEELVTPNTIWLMAYSEEDARLMLHRLAERHHVEMMNESGIHKILSKTGGHPGLIRTVFNIVYEQLANLDDLNATNKQVQDECQRIWHSLAEDEQMALANLVSGGKHNVIPLEMMERLRVKGLVGGSWAKPNKIFSTLLAEYILSERPIIGAHIYIDRKKRIVFVDDRAIEDLALLEYKLIEFLDGRRQQVVTREEIIAHLYPDAKVANGISDNRIDSIVKRLRKVIEPDPNQPRFILTMRGHGLELADGMPTENKETTK